MLYPSCGNMGIVRRVSLFGLRWCMRGEGRGLEPGYGRVGWRYVCVSVSVDNISWYQYIVLCGYLHILGTHSVQSCCTLLISATYRVFVCSRSSKPSLICVWLLDLYFSRRARFYEEQGIYPAGPHRQLVEKR